MKCNFNLGDEAKDTITGFKGVVTSITFWLNGCVRIGIQPKELKDGKPIDPIWFDQEQVELVKSSKKKKDQPTGGPKPNPTRV